MGIIVDNISTAQGGQWPRKGGRATATISQVHGALTVTEIVHGTVAVQCTVHSTRTVVTIHGMV